MFTDVLLSGKSPDNEIERRALIAYLVVCCSAVWCGAMCCNELQCVASALPARCSGMQWNAVRYSVLQGVAGVDCVAVCCRVL